MRIHKYISAALISGVVLFSGCDNKRDPGSTYMPDMMVSRGYETYAERDSAKFTMDLSKMGGNMIFYNNMPPQGTIKRGDLFPYTLQNDSNGYKLSAAVKNPFDTVSSTNAELDEAGRLYNINCGICHGAKGAADGPMATAGHIGGVANLTADVNKKLSDGTMFHVITYGKGIMGSYASQLSKQQRWMVIKYIRTLQGGGASDSTATAGKDSATVKK